MAGGRVPLLLLLLLLLSEPGYANEGSIAGSCHCDKRIPSSSPPSREMMHHLQKYLQAYHDCTAYIRFQLPLRSICGGKQDGWVQELLGCFRLQECGHAHRKDLARRQHFPPHNTQKQESPDEAPAGVHTTAQTNQATTLQSTQIPGAPGNESTTVPGNHSVGAGPEAWEDQKHLEESLGHAATTATGTVLSLLAISLLLFGVLIYVLCKRRGQQLPRYSPDVDYVSVRSCSMFEQRMEGYELPADLSEKTPEAAPSHWDHSSHVRDQETPGFRQVQF